MANQLQTTGSSALERADFRRAVMDYRSTHSINETIAYFGVSRSFVCKWQKRYRIDPFDMHDRSRRPNGCTKAYPVELKAKIKASLLIDNAPSRKRNKLAPTIFRYLAALRERTYTSIKRIANLLIGRCKRAGRSSSKKKIRTGCVNTPASVPGEIVQVDMKCVPTKVIQQHHTSDEVRKDGLIAAARQRMENTVNELDEQERAFPDLPIIRRLRDEYLQEYAVYLDDIRKTSLEPEKELKLYQYTAVDIKSRWTFRWIFSEHSELVALRFAIELMREVPFRIQCVQTDNGSEFVSDYLDGHDGRATLFQELLASKEIAHRRITKGKPWENGYVEAQHRIDQERLYDAMKVGSLEEGMVALADYQKESNLYPKPCLGMKSPMDMIREAI